MIDPFDEVENKEMPLEIRVKAGYEIFLCLFKFGLSILLIIIITLILKPEEGIVVESFEIAGMNESSVFVANHLCFELQTIKEIYSKSVENKERTKSINKEAPILPLFDLRGNHLEYSMTSLGNVGMGGTSLSLGHLILSLKQSTGSSSPKLTGSIQGSGSDLRIVAILNKPIMAWEIKKNISDDSCTFQEKIPVMIEDLAYQIANSLINENEKTNKGEFPKTWEALKYSTLSRKAYLRYDATGNVSYLNESKNFALIAQTAEPRYLNIYILLNNIGASYLDQDYPKEAEGLFRIASKINSSSNHSWEGLGVAYLLQNRYPDSIQAFNNIPLSKRFADTWYNMGLAYYYSGDYNASVNAFNESINITPDNGDAWYNKGSALEANGEHDVAIAAFDKALRLDPKDADTWYNRAISLESLNKSDEAIAAYDEAFRLNPKKVNATFNKGSLLFYRGDYDKAIQAFTEVLNLTDSKDEQAWFMISWSLFEKGNSLNESKLYYESIKAIDEALKLNSSYSDAWKIKGQALEELGDYDGSIFAYKKACETTSLGPNKEGQQIKEIM